MFIYLFTLFHDQLPLIKHLFVFPNESLNRGYVYVKKFVLPSRECYDELHWQILHSVIHQIAQHQLVQHRLNKSFILLSESWWILHPRINAVTNDITVDCDVLTCNTRLLLSSSIEYLNINGTLIFNN